MDSTNVLTCWLLTASVVACVPTLVTSLHSSPPVPLFRLVEQRLKFCVRQNDNPWVVNDCNAELQPPSGSRYENTNLSLALFFDGRSQEADTYAFRFAPDSPGTWHWELNCSKLTLAKGEPKSGTVVAASSAQNGRGGAVRAKTNPRFFEREDGSRWTPIGYEFGSKRARESDLDAFCWVFEEAANAHSSLHYPILFSNSLFRVLWVVSRAQTPTKPLTNNHPKLFFAATKWIGSGLSG